MLAFPERAVLFIYPSSSRLPLLKHEDLLFPSLCHVTEQGIVGLKISVHEKVEQGGW